MCTLLGTKEMIFREAQITDIPQIQLVRHAVKENTLSDPALVTDKDCADYLIMKGKGWVCEINGKIIGFAIVDLKNNNIWALFLRPEFEKQGIGKKLHDTMLDWYFSHTQDSVWLGTSPNTRAEHFYRRAGWIETGTHGKGEIKFEMTYNEWVYVRKKRKSNFSSSKLFFLSQIRVIALMLYQQFFTKRYAGIFGTSALYKIQTGR